MGRKFALVGDIGTDHDGFPPTAVTAGSPTVLIDGKSAARLGDPLAPHDKPKHSAHPRTIAEGSNTIFIDGKPAALTGHAVSCGGVVVGGASAVGGDTAAVEGLNLTLLSAPTSAAGETQAGQKLALSEAGKQWLKDVEQLRLTPYNDQTGQDITSWVEGATIGYGYLIPEEEWHYYKEGIDVAEADRLFEEELIKYENSVNSAIEADLEQHEFDAAVMLAYNIGVYAFAPSSAVEIINDASSVTPYPTLEDAWKAWKYSQGKVNRGLINRRAAEWDMYSKGIYSTW